jgi:hypothetical protein
VTAYQTLAEFKSLTLMTSASVDRLELDAPGWIAGQLELWSRHIDSRLGKRYLTPFRPPYPIVLQRWLTMLVTKRAYLKLGAFESDAQQKTISDDYTQAADELKESADANTGLFDLPLSDSQAGSGIAFAGPLVYSEQSPYVGGDVQVDVAHWEDQHRRGTP